MNRHSRALSTFFERIYALLSWICMALMLLIVGATFLQVFCRKALNAPLTWSEEFSRLVFIWMSCLGCAIAVRTKQHISFELLVDRCIPRAGQTAIRVLTDLMLIVFLLWTLPSSAELTARMNRTLSAALRWPTGLFYLGFAAGCAVTALAYAGDILEVFGIIRLKGEADDVG